MVFFNEILKCPNCLSRLELNKDEKEKLYCKKCHEEFIFRENYYDFINNSKLDDTSQIAIETWGRDLHKEGNKNQPHLLTIGARLNRYLKQINGNVLEIGCGTGSDIKELAKNTRIKLLVGLDIGENLNSLSKKFISNKKISFVRANAQSLPINEKVFDYIYSYGVIHHTLDPAKTLYECRRVLKDNGLIFLYIYSSHSTNLYKRIGVYIEDIIMKSLYLLPKRYKILFCYTMTPFAWIMFSLPAKILKLLGFNDLAKKIPFNWGTSMLSILPDIKDRFLAPVNHRYSKVSFEKILRESGLVIVDLVEDATGIYVVATPSESNFI